MHVLLAILRGRCERGDGLGVFSYIAEGMYSLLCSPEGMYIGGYVYRWSPEDMCIGGYVYRWSLVGMHIGGS